MSLIINTTCISSSLDINKPEVKSFVLVYSLNTYKF